MIAGPTAVGKTAVAVALAEKIGGEIVSADSMQVYKFMDIGTAKPSPEELARARHHMINEVAPDTDYSVVKYQAAARACIEDIIKRGKIPVLCGGSGFYIDAVLRGVSYDETEKNAAYREELAEEARRGGNGPLHARLKNIDPASYEKIHPNNVKRVIRALEFYNKTGKRISETSAEQKERGFYYRADIFILNAERSNLYGRIERRTDAMMEAGLVNETCELLSRGYGRELPAMNGLGYRQAAAHIFGELGLDNAAAEIKRATKNYAKRQLTWFRNQIRGEWIDATGLGAEDAAEIILSKIKF